MTEKEATKIRSAFSNGFQFPFGRGYTENCDMNEVNRHAELLDEAIKKQIPQKPKILSSGEFYSCPHCDIIIRKKSIFISLKWCKMCVVAHRLSFCYRQFSSNTIIAKKSMCHFYLVVQELLHLDCKSIAFMSQSAFSTLALISRARDSVVHRHGSVVVTRRCVVSEHDCGSSTVLVRHGSGCLKRGA